jgi:hypothetical protein
MLLASFTLFFALSSPLVAEVADKLVVKDSSNNTQFLVTDTGNVGIGTQNPSRGKIVIVPSTFQYSASFVSDEYGRGWEIITKDFIYGSVGSALQFDLGAGTGNTHGRIRVTTSGKMTVGDLTLL